MFKWYFSWYNIKKVTPFHESTCWTFLTLGQHLRFSNGFVLPATITFNIKVCLSNNEKSKKKKTKKKKKNKNKTNKQIKKKSLSYLTNKQGLMTGRKPRIDCARKSMFIFIFGGASGELLYMIESLPYILGWHFIFSANIHPITRASLEGDKREL